MHKNNETSVDERRSILVRWRRVNKVHIHGIFYDCKILCFRDLNLFSPSQKDIDNEHCQNSSIPYQIFIIFFLCIFLPISYLFSTTINSLCIPYPFLTSSFHFNFYVSNPFLSLLSDYNSHIPFTWLLPFQSPCVNIIYHIYYTHKMCLPVIHFLILKQSWLILLILSCFWQRKSFGTEKHQHVK